MNHFSYEVMGKEKVKDLLGEGLRSQAFHQSGAPRIAIRSALPKMVLALLGIIGLLGLLVH